MVVMPRHSRRFMADNALNDMQRHPRVRRERDERVPQRMERRLRRLMPAAFELYRGRDTRRLKDFSETSTHPPL